MGEFSVSHKEASKRNSSTSLGVKVQKQILEAFPSDSETMMMMVPPAPHNHHHPPLSPSDALTSSTTFMSTPNHTVTNHFVNGASSAFGAALVRPSQPFHISTSTPFKSSGGMMAASLGYPFTNAQWKELERQAMIYKYMMASIPVPPHLLIPMAASRSPLDSGSNLRFSSSNDAEPGRCRRTDGKKWRCSRDVAPNHKYCERHMHRGRPRSRKPVEVVQSNSTTTTTTNNTANNKQIKRARHDYPVFPAPAVTATISNSTLSNYGSSSSSQFLASTTTTQPHPHFGSSLGVKPPHFDFLPSVSSIKEPRGLEWVLKGDPISMAASDPEWHPLMQNRAGLNNNVSNYRDTLYMNAYEGYSSGLEQHNKSSPLWPNAVGVKQRGFIDAWCNAETEETNANKKHYVASSNAKLPLPSLDLSMGGTLDENMGSVHMGLGPMDAPAPWVASSTLGGPLAEVLRPTTTGNETGSNNNSNASSPMSPMVTVVASPSPSGVLQKTLASLSDSSTSSSSSPRVASSTSRANSEMASLCFNHTKLPSS
ncbi:growth-regulating factor 2 isoform X1 [Senna tora]|uniref:Growth-regulating factor n=1 Tax=Senna tora TaxID=362788 RepID=A0A834T6C3_9FABA|nr:growth-regulating factor 2 isoform X1 [Senna tora]